MPTLLGTSLVDAYRNIGLTLYQPDLRAQMEADMKEIAEGRKGVEEVLGAGVREMEGVYAKINKNKQEMQRIFA